MMIIILLMLRVKNLWREELYCLAFPLPSMQKWYSDPEYQDLSEHRRASVTTTLTRISGLPPRK